MILLAGVELDCYLNLQEKMDDDEFVDELGREQVGQCCKELQGHRADQTGMAQD